MPSVDINTIGTSPGAQPTKYAPIVRVTRMDVSAGGPGTTCSGSYTFYQRVFDDTFLFWCYYSGSTVNAAPGITDTTPNNSGFISGHSITYTTSEIVCS